MNLRFWQRKAAPVPVYNDAYEDPYADIWNRQPAPTSLKLLQENRETAYACAELNANAFADVPLRLYITTGKGQSPTRNFGTKTVDSATVRHLEANAGFAGRLSKAVDLQEVVEHPLLDLLNNPATGLSRFDLFELSDRYQEFEGNAYWHVKIGPLGIPAPIVLLPSHLVTTVRAKNGLGIAGYEYGSRNNKIMLSADSVIPFRFPNLLDPYADGWSPVRAMWETINLQNQDRSHLQALMGNRARPDTVVSPKEQLGEHEADRLWKRFMRMFNRGGSGGVAVTAEPVTITPLSFPPRDMEALARYGVGKVAIANAFGVPMSMLETKDVNRANAEAGEYQHAKHAIEPRCTRFEAKLNRRLVPMYGERFFLAFDSCVPDDRVVSADIRVKDLGSGVVTINEARVEIGLPEVDWGNEPWIPFNLSQPGGVAATDIPTPTIPEDEDTDEDGKDFAARLADIIDRNDKDVPSPPPVEDHHEHEHDHPIDAWSESKAVGHRRRMPHGRQLAKILRGLFKEQRAEVIGGMKAFVTARQKSTEFLPNPAASIIWDDWDQKFAKRCAPFVQVQLAQGAEDAFSRLGVSDIADAWSVTNPKVQQAVDQATMSFCSATNATTKLSLELAAEKTRAELAAGLFGSENALAELTKRVSTIYTQAESYRAERIARTEASRALHLGQQIAAEESGVVSGYRWLLSGDACPACQMLAASVPEVPIGTNFSVEGSGPYSDIPSPPLHPNCMCTITEVLTRE